MAEIRRLRDPYTTIGIAMHFVGRFDPFASFRARELVATIDGQVRRGHYLLAFEELKVVGYLGWALFDEATAARFADSMQAPSNAVANGGDVVWLLTAAATEPGVLKQLVQTGRRLYPGRRVMGVRHRANGRSTLLRCIAGRPQA